jgi:hypothetical protein
MENSKSVLEIGEKSRKSVLNKREDLKLKTKKNS